MLASKHEELKSGITDKLARLEAKIDAAKSEVVDPGTTLTTTTSHLSTSDLPHPRLSLRLLQWGEELKERGVAQRV